MAWPAAVLALVVTFGPGLPGRTLERWASIAADLGLASLIVVSSSGLGLLVASPQRLPGLTPVGRLVLAAITGMGLTSLGWLALGQLGLLHPIVAWIWVIAGSAGAAVPFRAWCRSRPAVSSSSTLVRWFIVPTGVMSLVAALCPPTAFDGLFYHLFTPQQWIRNGWMGTWQSFPHLHFPHLVESLFLPAMLTRGDIAATLLHWAFLPAALWLIRDMTRQFVPSASPSLAVAFALAMPNVPVLASSPYTDVALACFQIGTIWGLLNWRSTRASSWLITAGALAGFAMGVKYTSFVVPLIGVLIVAWTMRRHRRGLLRSLVIFSGPAVALAAPWYLRTWWETGNPFYPFLFGGADWTAVRAAHYSGSGTGFGWNLFEWLRLPLWATLSVGDANYWDSTIGPLPLMVLPVAVWAASVSTGPSIERRDEREVVILLLGVFALQAGAWALGAAATGHLRQNRLLMPALLTVVPALSYGIARLRLSSPRESDRSTRTVVTLLVALALVWSFAVQLAGLAALNPLPWLGGHESRAAFYAARLGGYAEAMHATGALLDRAKLLFLYEPRAYLAQRPSHPDAILDEFERRLAADGSLEDVAQRLLREGYTHLVVAHGHLAILRAAAGQRQPTGSSHDLAEHDMRSDMLDALEQLLTLRARQVWRARDGTYAIYELRAADTR